jgi:hypothetical protein
MYNENEKILNDDVKDNTDKTLPEIPEIVSSEEETFADEQFEEGESLVGEKYKAPIKDDKFLDVHSGLVLDKKDVSPLLQIKAFFDSTNVKYKDPNKSCKKCYGRGYTGFNISTQAWVPCTCLYPPKTENERKDEGDKFVDNLQKVYALKNLNRWEKKTRTKLIHQKALELLKKNNDKNIKGIELSAIPSETQEVVNG